MIDLGFVTNTSSVFNGSSMCQTQSNIFSFRIVNIHKILGYILAIFER